MYLVEHLTMITIQRCIGSGQQKMKGFPDNLSTFPLFAGSCPNNIDETKKD